jgi:hypothetical protein
MSRRSESRAASWRCPDTQKSTAKIGTRDTVHGKQNIIMSFDRSNKSEAAIFKSLSRRTWCIYHTSRRFDRRMHEWLPFLLACMNTWHAVDIPWGSSCGGQVLRVSNGLKQLNCYRGSGGNEKLPPRRIPMVGIVRKVPSTRTQLSHKHHHHGGAVCPSYGVVTLDMPDPTRLTSFEGVGRGRIRLIN